MLDKKICLFSFAKGTPTRCKQYSGSTNRPIFLGLPTLGSSWTRCITLEAKKRFAVFWMVVTHRIHIGLVYLPTWMVDVYGFHLGKHTIFIQGFFVGWSFSRLPFRKHEKKFLWFPRVFNLWFLLTGTCCLGICPRGWGWDGMGEVFTSNLSREELSEVNVLERLDGEKN